MHFAFAFPAIAEILQTPAFLAVTMPSCVTDATVSLSLENNTSELSDAVAVITAVSYFCNSSEVTLSEIVISGFSLEESEPDELESDSFFILHPASETAEHKTIMNMRDNIIPVFLLTILSFPSH